MRVLKLDASFQPVGVIPWTEAFRLMFLDKAEVIEEYDDLVIRSTNDTFKVPSVIKLVSAVARKEKYAKFSRENIFIRDSYACQYCGKDGSSKDLTLDHVYPASLGGLKTWENIVAACQPCNIKKGDKTLKEAKMSLATKPYQPKWSPRIAIKMKSVDPDNWSNYVRY